MDTIFFESFFVWDTTPPPGNDCFLHCENKALEGLRIGVTVGVGVLGVRVKT